MYFFTKRLYTQNPYYNINFLHSKNDSSYRFTRRKKKVSFEPFYIQKLSFSVYLRFLITKCLHVVFGKHKLRKIFIQAV